MSLAVAFPSPPRRGTLGVFCTLTAVLLPAALPAADPFRPPAISISSPFHADECVPALRESLRQLRRDRSSRRWRRILGQGFLCLGLKNDPAALRHSIRVLEDLVAGDGVDDWQALMAIAGARCAFAPLAAETRPALERARVAVVGSRSNSERERMAREIAENRAGIEERSRFLAPVLAPVGSSGEAGAWDGPASEPEGVPNAGRSAVGDAPALTARLGALMEHGPGAGLEATRVLETIVAVVGDGSTYGIWKAELQRWEGHYAAAMETLDAVLSTGCRTAPATQPSCILARSRRTLLEERCRDWSAIAAELGFSPCATDEKYESHPREKESADETKTKNDILARSGSAAAGE